MKPLTTTHLAATVSLVLAVVAANLPAFASEQRGPPVIAINPCCGEQVFQGVGVPVDGVMIQLVEVKRIGPTAVRATWTLRNTTKAPQRLTKGGSGSSDGYHLAYDAELVDPSAGTKFAVVKSADGTLLAARHPPAGPISGIVMGANRTMTTWATFAVPAAVTQVTVDLPGASVPWDGVTIVGQNRQ